MTAVKNNSFIKVISLLLALITMLSAFTVTSSVAEAASKPAQAYVAVKNAYGKSFPLSSKDRVKGKKRVYGVKTSLLSSYYYAEKFAGNNKSATVYRIIICKPKNKSDIKSIKSKFASSKSNEQQSMSSYLSAKGKKLFKNCKIGSVNGYVYVVMIDTNANKKAIAAIKKTLG